MAVLIHARRIAVDRWHWLDAGTDARPSGPVVVPCARWVAEREAWLERGGELGVVLGPEDEPAVLAPDVLTLSLIAVRFPAFTDGRGYSMARLLRERHGYRGELRAVGEVLRDQLGYLARVGFDAFALRADQDASQALAAFGEFSEAYQASVDRPEPLFRRRAVAAAGTGLPSRPGRVP